MTVHNLMEEIVAISLKEMNHPRLADCDEKTQLESDVFRELSNAIEQVLDSPRKKDF